jgi:flagellar basal-body rod protein FlgF
LIRGWYTAASGMRAQQWRLDAVANNLANVNTDGYKRDVAAFKAFPELLLRRQDDDGVYLHPFGSGDAAPFIGKMGTGVELNEPFPHPGASVIPATALSSLAKKASSKPKRAIL